MNQTANTYPGISLKQLAWTSGICVLYLLLSFLLIGFRPEQLALVILFNLLFYASAASRKFIIGFSVFIVYWILYDYMKAFPNYRFSPVHIEGLYRFEKQLFGITAGSRVMTPNEYFLVRSNLAADLLSGFFYLCWIPVPLAFAAYLFFKDKGQFLRFSFTFLLVNLLGFVVYYLYPAAPPWYVHYNGFTFDPLTPGNTAGLNRFDRFFGVNIFGSLYARGSNVFAAMPSLHSAYPLIVLYFGVRLRMRYASLFFSVVTGGIWFAAVYTGHHYIVDVVAGIACAAAGIWLFNQLLKRGKAMRILFYAMLRSIN